MCYMLSSLVPLQLGKIKLYQKLMKVANIEEENQHTSKRVEKF